MQSHNPKKPIANIVMMGDSLSRGTLNHSKLLGFIPMSIITHFAAKTHHNRFTNAETWDDDFGASMVAELFLRNLRDEDRQRFGLDVEPDSEKGKEEAIEDADLADDLIVGRHPAREDSEAVINLSNDKRIPFCSSQDYMRTYCQGGLTAHDWRRDRSHSIAELGSREILATLKDKRKELIADDRRAKRTPEEKEQTLIVEWSGGNDLITVNAKPTMVEANKAIEARIQNVRQLIARGYRNFVLFELPDLSLTPRFAEKSAEEAEDALNVVEYFNQQLRNRCAALLEDRTIKEAGVSLDVFGVNKLLRDVHHHPAKYGFTDVEHPFVDSPEYQHENAERSPLSSQGHMFWDDIHPTGHMHAMLAESFTDWCSDSYEFIDPPRALTSAQDMYEVFQTLYNHKLQQDMGGLFGCFRRGRLGEALQGSVITEDEDNIDYERALAKILEHALHHKGYRSRGVLRKLGWINRRNQINTDIPVLQRAKADMEMNMRAAQNDPRRLV